MPVTIVPAFPLRSQGLTQAVYSAGVESSLSAMPQFITDLNAVGSAYSLSTNATSSTSVLIGTGSKSFTTQLNLGYAIGMTLRIANTSANYMTGDVTSYNTGTGALVMNITAIVGTGTFASWFISMSAVGANAAASVSYTAGGNIAATNVQSAIQELDTEKAKIGANTDITSLAATGGVDVLGTNTNDNALAGYMGEYVESIIPSASFVGLTSNTPINLTSISLTAGDWDVSGNALFNTAATTTVQSLAVNSSSVSATVVATNLGRIVYNSSAINTPANGAPAVVMPSSRFSLSATTTIYLVVNAIFGTASCSVFGMISARRVR